MAAGALAALTVSLGLDAAEFTSGLTKADYQLAQLNKSIRSFSDSAKHAFELAGIGISVAGVVEFAKSTIEAAEHLQNLSVATGSTVEELSRLSNIAKISGTSFDTFQTLIDRLAAGMSGAEDKSTRVGEALKLIGVTASDPAQALQQVADKFAKFADGANKAALAKDIFGRGGVQFLSTLKDIAEQTDVTASKTADQAKAATDLAEKFRRLAVDSHTVADALLNDVVPALTTVVTAFAEATRVSGGFFAGLAVAGGISPFSSIDENIERTKKELETARQTITDVKASADGLWAKIAPSSQDTSALDTEVKNLEDRLKVLGKLKGDALGNLDFLNKDRRPVAPILPPKSTGAVDDPTKALLEAAIKAIEADIAKESSLLSERNDILGKLYGENLLSIKDYFSDRSVVSKAALSNQLADYDLEIAKEREFIAKSTTTNVQRAKAEGDIVEITKKRQAAIDSARKSDIDAFFEEERAARDYRNTLNDLTAQVLVYKQNTAAAAGIKFDIQTEQLRARLQVEGNKAAEQQLDLLRAQAQAQAVLNDVQKAGATRFDAIANAQSRIDLAVQTGNETELQAYADKAAIAQKYIGDLNRIADAAEVAARATGDPAQIQAVDNFRLHIEQLASASDALAAKFRGAFEDSFSTALDSIINRTKSVKDAVSDAAKSVGETLTHLATQDIAQRLFGKDGPLGGVSDVLSKAFGGAGSGASGVTSLGTAAIGATPSINALSVAAASAASALLASSTGATASQIGNLGFAALGAGGDAIGDLGGIFGGLFARGGSPPMGKVSIVGENGPEYFVPKTSGTIVPNGAIRTFSPPGGGGDTHIYNISVPLGTSGKTANQFAKEFAREIASKRRVT